MFYVVSKSIWFFLQPSNLILSVLAGGLALASFTQFTIAGLRMAWGGLALLVAGGLLPLSNVLVLPLENRFPAPSEARAAGPRDGPIAGIIVLGGYEDGRITAARGTLTLNEAAERLTETALLAHRHPQARVIVSGGAGAIVREDRPAANEIADYLTAIGIARERITVEGRSTTTQENAMLTRALVAPKSAERWLLVTSAAHMPRAMGTFRRQGFDVVAWPVDFRTKDAGDLLRPFQAFPRGLRRLDDAATEWVGLVAYRLLGRSDALFPGP